jgi:hypothetical protein
LRTYEEQRFDRTAEIVNAAWGLGGVLPWRNPFGCWLRDTCIRWTPARQTERRLLKMLDFSVE